MNKKILSIYIIIAGILVAGAASAIAQTRTSTASEVIYPIAELGNCADKTACAAYCDKSENVNACLNFAEKNNLMTKEEVSAARSFNNTGMTGPGGCKGKEGCNTYCTNPGHLDECIAFAEKNNLMSPAQLEEAKKVQAAIARGVKPPACRGQEECDTYCSAPEHMEECVNFSIEAGIMDQKKQDESRKALTAIKNGIKPPACKGKDACDVYCKNPDHMEECMNFAITAGMISGEEKDKAEKALGAIKQGIKPPACNGEEGCRLYCSEPNHLEECITFGEAIGKITKEEAYMIRQTGGKRPGGAPPGQGPEGVGVPTGPGVPGSGPNGGPNQGDGFNPGSGKGGSGQNNPNPVKCIEDCEYTGRICLAEQSDAGNICASNGQYCRQVTCEALVDAEGNRATAEVMRDCNDTKCRPPENACYAEVVARSSECTTKKDQCVTSCQKASKPTKSVAPTGPAGTGGSQPPQPPTGEQTGSGGFQQPPPIPPGGGPGGCKSPKECKLYCASHKEECNNFRLQLSPG